MSAEDPTTSGRTQRLAARQRHPHWHRAPVAIEILECINCDRCLDHCPPQFGAIVKVDLDVVIVPELCSGCDLCLPSCPVDCIRPDPDWQQRTTPEPWWAAAARRGD